MLISDTEITMKGELWGMVTLVQYNLTLSFSKENPTLLHFEVNTIAAMGSFNRIFLNYWCNTDELFYGFGVQYSHFNMKGRRVPILGADHLNLTF